MLVLTKNSQDAHHIGGRWSRPEEQPAMRRKSGTDLATAVLKAPHASRKPLHSFCERAKDWTFVNAAELRTVREYCIESQT